jgi:hypothetical protein
MALVAVAIVVTAVQHVVLPARYGAEPTMSTPGGLACAADRIGVIKDPGRIDRQSLGCGS